MMPTTRSILLENVDEGSGLSPVAVSKTDTIGSSAGVQVDGFVTGRQGFANVASQSPVVAEL